MIRFVLAAGLLAGSWAVAFGATRHFVEPPPGDTQTQRSHATPPTPTRISPATADACLDARRDIARLERLRRDLELQIGLARGELEAQTGAPQGWPDQVPEQFSEAYISDQIDALLTSSETQDSVDIDCIEFPCVVRVRGPVRSRGAPSILGKLKAVVPDAVIHTRTGVSREPGGVVRVRAWAAYPEELAGEELEERTLFRLEQSVLEKPDADEGPGEGEADPSTAP